MNDTESSTINKKEFLDVLSIVRNGLDTRGTVPIFSYVCISDDVIMSFDGVNGIVGNITSTNIDACIPGTVLLTLVKSMTDETINLHQKGETIEIGTAKIATLPSEKFPFKKVDVPDDAITICINDEVISVLKDCLSIADKDALLPYESGITVIAEEGTNITFCASDHIRIIKRVIEENSFGTLKAVIPYGFCRLLHTIARSDSTGILHIWKDNAVCNFENVSVYTKLDSNIKVLDFNNTIASYMSVANMDYIKLDNAIRVAVNRVASIFSEKDLVTLTSKDDKLVIAGKNGVCEITEVVSATLDLPSTSCDILVGALKDIVDITEEVGFTTRNDTVVLIGKKEDTILLTATL